MTAGSDINQLTISEHIDHRPQLRQEDGQAVCEFLLTQRHTACS